MRFDCEAARENIDAWAIGALEPEEMRAVDVHVSTCADCRALADEAAAAAASLAMAVPLHGASAALKSRVMASAAVLTDLKGARRSRFWPAAAAALVVLGVGAFSWGAMTQMQVNDLRSQNDELAADATAQARDLFVVRADLFEATNVTSGLSETVETQDAVIDLVLQPDVQRTELVGTAEAPNASGRCVWSRAQALGAFIASNLPPAPLGFVYKMWIVYERDWVGAGSVDVDEAGRGRLIMRGAWGASAGMGALLGFAVTLEPADGSTSGDRGKLVMSSGF